MRGRLSYEQAVNRALETYGLNRIGYKLTLYRATFHLVGSIVFIILIALLSKKLFGSDSALYVLLCATILALSFQEFYLHPKLYGQHFKKGVADLLAWVAPMVFYLFLFK